MWTVFGATGIDLGQANGLGFTDASSTSSRSSVATSSEPPFHHQRSQADRATNRRASWIWVMDDGVFHLCSRLHGRADRQTNRCLFPECSLLALTS